MALTYAERQELPDSAFVFPGSRRYPIPDEAHARNALARVSQHGTPAERRAVCREVARRFPSIHESHCPIDHRSGPRYHRRMMMRAADR